MFGFINHINDEEELLEQIKKQTKLGFCGYFLKKMFTNGMTYNKGENVNEKKALQIIAPQQSLFALVRDNYENTCLKILKTIYGKMPDNHLNLTSGLKDVLACMNLDTLYVTERDTDISMGDEGFFERLLKRKERQFNIYIPPYISSDQMKELLKTMRDREDFKRWFNKDFIYLNHYISKDNIQYFSGVKALEYIVEELPAWVREDMPVNPDEKIIVAPYRNIAQRANAPFVEKVDTSTVTATIKPKAVSKQHGELPEGHGDIDGQH